MENKVFREIGFWGSLGLAVLGIINCIIYAIKGIRLADLNLNDYFEAVFLSTTNHCFASILGVLTV